MNKCIDCHKKLTGHSNPKRCKKCNQKFLHPYGRKYPHCEDCGKELKTYHSNRCRHCANTGELSSQFIDGRTSANNYHAKYTTNRRNVDINFKLAGNLRPRIRLALKGICKSKTTLELLGCSIEFLKQHLEKQFTKGMNWTNYGKWHIDHIKPCASFNLSKVSEQKKCFNWKNLQPLWAEDNLRKSDTMILAKKEL
jgi:hypothetical protein